MATNTDDITSQSRSLFACSREQIRHVENRLNTYTSYATLNLTTIANLILVLTLIPTTTHSPLKYSLHARQPPKQFIFYQRSLFWCFRCTSSNAPPARKPPTSRVHRGMISDPTPADQPVQPARAPPSRPTGKQNFCKFFVCTICPVDMVIFFMIMTTS